LIELTIFHGGDAWISFVKRRNRSPFGKNWLKSKPVELCHRREGGWQAAAGGLLSMNTDTATSAVKMTYVVAGVGLADRHPISDFSRSGRKIQQDPRAVTHRHAAIPWLSISRRDARRDMKSWSATTAGMVATNGGNAG
jgi:hypothetical protein